MDALTVDSSTGQEATKSQYRFVIAGLIVVSHLALGLNFYSASPVLPLIIEDYSVSHAAAGVVVTLGILGFALFGIPGAVIVSRLGLRNSVTLGTALMTLMLLTAVVPNFGSLLALRLVYGLGAALMFTAQGAMVMRWFGTREILIVNGVTTGAVTLGVTLSVATVAPLSDIVGWATALSIFSIVGVVATVGWLLLGGRAGSASPTVPMVSRKVLREMLFNPTVLLVVAANAGLMIQYTTLSTWLPTFFNEIRGMSLSEAGFITGLLPFVGLFSVLLGGILPARFGHQRLFFIIPGVMIVLAGPGSFLLEHIGGIYASVLILGFFTWLVIPSILSVPMQMRDTSPEKVSVVFGYILTVEGVTTFLFPLLVGGLRDLMDSFVIGFGICAVFALAVLAAGVLIPKGDIEPEPAMEPA